MKIIFLDFDGCINPFSRISPTCDFSKVCCYHVQGLLNKVSDLKIVISSSWRSHGIEFCKDILQKNGIDSTKVIDTIGVNDPHTPQNYGDKCYHLENWLENHKEVENFVVIDDEFVVGPSHYNNLVKTNPFIGITSKDIEKAIEILSKK